MRKTFVIAILMVLLCAVTFLFVHALLSPAPGVAIKAPTQDYTTSTTYPTNGASTSAVTQTASSTSSSAVAASSAANADGPFPLLASDGTPTDATVNILRSPEEVLVQFKNFSASYPEGSHLYLSHDLHATDHIDLGPARFTYGVYLYGIPLDTDLSAYPYLGIFSTSSDSLLFYTKLQ